jgi:tetratricopeptide (TPR) repeat protein
MNIKTYLAKHNDRTLQDDEWEQLAQTLIEAKFDLEKQDTWTKLLRDKGIHRSPALTHNSRSTYLRKYMAIAAALLVMVVAGWFFFLKSPLSPAQLMASHYLDQPFQLDQGNTRGAESMEVNRGKATVAFEMKQYEQSLQYLKIIEAQGNPKAADLFQMGLCLMYQKTPDYTKAINAFTAAQQADPLAYADDINWFSGLCHLMNGDEAAARISLQKVVDSPSSRNQQAAIALLLKLK